MPATQEPNSEVILQIINHYTPEVLQTMAGLTSTPGAGTTNAPQSCVLSGVAGAIALSGNASGVVYTAFPVELAKLVAEKMLGGAVSDQDISDIVSELTNMIGGNFKSQLCDLGFNCTLSIPTVVKGDKINIAAKSAAISVRNEYTVEGGSEPLVIQAFAVFK
jgi:chemotaxis protein CheX